MDSFQSYRAKPVAYTAVILNETSRQKLLNAFRDKLPAGWNVIAHHMTVNMGSADKGPAHEMLGKEVMLFAETFASDNFVIAVGVKTEVPSINAVKHITLAVNTAAGGKPVMSNKLINWEHVSPIVLKGVVEEVSR